jgi:hypothetical protein
MADHFVGVFFSTMINTFSLLEINLIDEVCMKRAALRALACGSMAVVVLTACGRPAAEDKDPQRRSHTAGVPGGDYDWHLDGVLSAVSTESFTGQDYGSVYYKDVMTHTPAAERYLQSGPSTHVHETLHGMHNFMRNSTREKDGFFYYGNGQGIYILEPKENLSDVKNHIGASFRQLAQSRYDLYLVSQPSSWPNTLYIFDEWNAYLGTTRSAVEIKRAGHWDSSQNSDPIEGLVDFMYFCSASILSIKNVDPDYLRTNKQFKAGFAMIMEESGKWVNESKNEPLWSGSRAWNKMQNFQTAADGAEVRRAVKDLMGDAWTLRVLGF